MSYFGIPLRNGLPIGLGSVAALGTNAVFNPASLFANGEQGWVYDPSNFATLFQDSAGTTPVTAVEQPVGLQLDLSKNLVLGPELVPDSSFDSAGSWTPQNSDWVVAGGKATYTESATAIVYLQSNANITLTGGKWYEVRCTFSGIASGTATFGLFNKTASVNLLGAYATVTTNGVYVQRIYVASTVTGIRIYGNNSGSATSWSFDDFSIKELPGNHRFQATSANRPLVSARVNLLTKTEDFANAAWAKVSIAVAVPSVVATGVVDANGGNTASTLAFPAVTGSQLSLTQQAYALTPATSKKFRVVLKASRTEDVGKTIYVYINDNGGAGILNRQTVVLTSSYQTITSTGTPTGTTDLRFVIGILGAGYSGIDQAAFRVDVCFPDARDTNQGVDLPAYQYVNTSTDYTSTGFPIYIKPNGSNQFMQTNSINFTATDKMTVWQGVRKLSDTAQSVVAELSASIAANNGAFLLAAPNSAAANYNFASKGTTQVNNIVTTYTSPITNVLAAASDISGPANSVKVNGGAATTVTSTQGTGNYGNYPAYFYARAGTSLFFGGNDYGSIVRGAASTATQITAGETWVNNLTKAY